MSGAVVTDFSHHTAEFASRPFEMMADLRVLSPVVWSTAHDGFWVITGHDEVTEGLADADRFSSAYGLAIPPNPYGTRHIPVGVDPPLHTTYRRALNNWFSKTEVTRREPEIRTFVREVVADLAARGSWDFVSDLADVIPGAVTLGILGWDRSRRVELLAVMAKGLATSASTDPAVIEENRRGNLWVREQILAEAYDRRARPRDDLMTMLATETFGDKPMGDDEISDTVIFLLLAGFHTTSGSMASLLVQMAHDPALRGRLDQDRDMIPDAIEEAIRIYGPLTGVARQVTQDTELGGVSLAKGDMALFMNAGANLDPAAFPSPETFDLDRNRAKSVAFGWGIHRCMGLHLARLTLKLEVEAVFDLLPGYEIDLDRIRRAANLGIGYFYETVPAALPEAPQ